MLNYQGLCCALMRKIVKIIHDRPTGCELSADSIRQLRQIADHQIAQLNRQRIDRR